MEGEEIRVGEGRRWSMDGGEGMMWDMWSKMVPRTCRVCQSNQIISLSIRSVDSRNHTSFPSSSLENWTSGWS